MTVDDHGRSVVVGGTATARLTPQVARDESFGAAEGFAVPGGESAVELDLTSVHALPGGALLVAGEWQDGMVVFRLRPDGRLEDRFGREGVARVGFGARRSCRAADLAVRHDGRIVLVGRCRGLERRRGFDSKLSVTRAAVARLFANGAPDPSFGRRGRLFPRVGAPSRATAVALRGGSTPVAGRLQRGVRKVDLLTRLRPNGRPDRRFGSRGGVVRVPLKVLDGETMPHEELRVFTTPRRILLVRAGRGWPVLAFRHNGRREVGFARGAHLVPGRCFDAHRRQTPIAAMQGSDLILAWAMRRPSPRGDGKLELVGRQRVATD